MVVFEVFVEGIRFNSVFDIGFMDSESVNRIMSTFPEIEQVKTLSKHVLAAHPIILAENLLTVNRILKLTCVKRSILKM